MVYKRATPPLGVCLGSFEVPLDSFWVALGLLWGALVLLWGALELLWAALGPPWASKLWGPSWGGQCEFGMHFYNKICAFGIHIPVMRVMRKWCHEVLLGAPLPHAPGVRMT